mgnify:CR=1 FL=1
MCNLCQVEVWYFNYRLVQNQEKIKKADEINSNNFNILLFVAVVMPS